jgi:hypothetical protein
VGSDDITTGFIINTWYFRLQLGLPVNAAFINWHYTPWWETSLTLRHTLSKPTLQKKVSRMLYGISDLAVLVHIVF